MGKHHGQNSIVQGWGVGAICTCLAVSNHGLDVGKQADLSQEFCRGCSHSPMIMKSTYLAVLLCCISVVPGYSSCLSGCHYWLFLILPGQFVFCSHTLYMDILCPIQWSE